MTHLSRPRLWITVLLTTLSLLAFATLRARMSHAQAQAARTESLRAIHELESQTRSAEVTPTPFVDSGLVGEQPAPVGFDFNEINFNVALPVPGVRERTAMLKAELQKAERDSEQAARFAREQTTPQAKDEAQARVRNAVSKAFAARQSLQQLEAELLRDRLRQVDDRLKERDKLRDRIIQRRVEELTNSNLNWGASEPLDLSSADRSQPLTQAPQSPYLVPQSDPLLAPEAAEKFHGVMYFEAAWCAPCQRLNPILSKLEKEGLVFRRIDTDKNPQLVQQFRVTAIPTFIRCFEGREVQRIEGLATEDRIREIIAASRYRIVYTKPIPRTTVPPPQSKSKGNLHLLGDAPALGTSNVPVNPPTAYEQPTQESTQEPTEEVIPMIGSDDVSIALVYTIYEANEAALKELGLAPKSNEEINNDNKLGGTTIVTDTAKINMLPELLKREDLKLRTRGTSFNKLNAPLPLLGVSQDELGESTDVNHGLELLAQATTIKNGRVHLFVKMGHPKSNRPLTEVEPVLFKMDLLLNSLEPSLVGPFKRPGENNPWLIASFVAKVQLPLPKRPSPGLRPRTVAPDQPTSEHKPFDSTSSGRDLPNLNLEPSTERTGPPAEAVAIVNGEAITYRNLVRWRISLKELDGGSITFF